MPEFKKAAEEGRTIVFVDESGLYLLPFTRRTYAPKKETPVLRHKLNHEHLSVISGITEQGRLYIQVREKSLMRISVKWQMWAMPRQASGRAIENKMSRWMRDYPRRS
ncbi:MAG: transposase [Desulfovibrio sp.]|jgi:hypothetical protein|nr:transposase [Desulfovibrio sp.]